MAGIHSETTNDRWLLDHLPVAILMTRLSDLQIVATNDRFQRIFHGTAEDFRGHDARGIVTGDETHRIEQSIAEMRNAADGTRLDNFRVFRRHDGEEFIGWVRAQRHTHPDHGAVAIATIFEYYDPTTDARNFADYVIFRNDVIRGRIASHLAHELNAKLSSLTGLLDGNQPVDQVLNSVREQIADLTNFGKRLFRIGLQSAEAARFLDAIDESSPADEHIRFDQTSILVIDDDRQFGQLFVGLLSSIFERADLASSGAEAIEKLSGAQYDVAIVDLSLGEEDGRVVAREIQSRFPTTKVIYMTGFAHASAILEAMGSTNHLRKPFEMTDVEREVRRVLQR